MVGVHISSYSNVKAKAEFLGCNPPRDLAILPSNFGSAQAKTSLHYEPVAYLLRQLFIDNGIVETPLEREGERFLLHLQESEILDWVLPTLFVSYAFVSQNPRVIAVALNVIANNVSELFRFDQKNTAGTSQDMQMTIAVETRSGDCRLVTYRGPAASFDQVLAAIHEVNSHD
jgi:hypothetical protein